MLQQLKLSMENELIKHTAQERSGRSFIIKKLPIQFAWARLISKMIMRNGTNILLHDTPAHFVHTYIHTYIFIFIYSFCSRLHWMLLFYQKGSNIYIPITCSHFCFLLKECAVMNKEKSAYNTHNVATIARE